MPPSNPHADYPCGKISRHDNWEGGGPDCGLKIAFDSARKDRWIFFTKHITSAEGEPGNISRLSITIIQGNHPDDVDTAKTRGQSL